MRKILFFMSSLLALLLLFTGVGYADDGDVIVSEVMFNSACESSGSTGTCGSGTSSEVQFEWVEIHNGGGTAIDLTGWTICDENPGTGHVNCDGLGGSIDAGEYLIVAHNNDSPNFDLQDELDNYSATVVTADTIFLNDPIGYNGIANSGDTIFLVTDGSNCGPGSNLPCVSDCVSWDTSNTCASLIDDTNRAFLPGSDGADDAALDSGIQDGQSIVNIAGTWYQCGPSTNQANQASPYGSNTREGGATAIILFSLSARDRHSGALAAVPPLLRASLLGACLLAVAAGLIIRKRRRPH